MLDLPDFKKKQILEFIPMLGDKISYRNDNIIISASDGSIKYQISCYRVFMLLIIGDCTITTGILRRARKYGFAICFMTYSCKLYSVINAGMEGNTLLHQKQYSYSGLEVAKAIILNKIKNQRDTLNKIRKKNDFEKEGINLLEMYMKKIADDVTDRNNLLAIEGNASKVYFSRLFSCYGWKGRKPRIKYDYINCLLDIGYTILFNFIDSVLQVYGFDVYKGVLHTCFYMRKSLVCDLMEPFRPIIDWRVRKGIVLGQFKHDDFHVCKNQYQLDYKKTASYTAIFLEEILNNKEFVFVYIRSFYRNFMKMKEDFVYSEYNINTNEG